MKTYTLQYSWRKPGGPFQHVVQLIEAASIDDAKREAWERLKNVGVPTWCVTLEESATAGAHRPYAASRKRKNTNAWRPRRYGGRA